jgi:integrase
MVCGGHDMKREHTEFRGVYQRLSDKRVFKKKPDVCFDISYKYKGKLVWEKVGWLSEGYNAKMADQVRAERVRSIRHGLELPKEKKAPYFKDVASKYLMWAQKNKAREGKDDASLYKNHLSEFFDDKQLNGISSFDLERFKADLSKKGLSPASVKHCLVLFRQIVNKAIAWRLYQGENPIKGVKMPTVQNQKLRFLSHDEAIRLLNALSEKSETLHDMALLSLHTGLRAGEIFNLKGQDLDFINGIITVIDTKNKRTRQAFMTDSVKTILMNRKPASPDIYIFRDRRHGGKIQAVSALFRRVVTQLKFNKGVKDPRQKMTFHSLRHTFASWLALQGETLLTIKELLGHQALAMTERYSHLIPDHKRRAVLTLESAFNGEKIQEVVK